MTRFSYFSGPAPIQMSTAFTFMKEDCDANLYLKFTWNHKVLSGCRLHEMLLCVVVDVYTPYCCGLSEFIPVITKSSPNVSVEQEAGFVSCIILFQNTRVP